MDIKKVSQEELASEQQATKELKEEEVRAKVIEEFGFDEEADSEKIEKLTKKEIENSKKLSSAIGAKIKHRTEAQKLAEEIKKNKEGVIEPKEPKNDINQLSPIETIAIMRANVHADDIDEVVEYARFKGISIPDALKTTVIRGLLSEREEFRKSDEVANTNSTRRTVNKVTPESLLKNLSKGEIPDAGSKDAEELFYARRGGRR